jgi:large subunit ribosomal protein L24
MASKLKKNDQVIVTTGKSKGHVGSITSILDKGFIIVSGANIRKKCIKADPQNNIKGEIKSIEGKIHHSNVALYDADKKVRIKVGFKKESDKPKVRVNKQTGEPV